MSNPWMSIPLADYEGHMGASGVGQLDALAELFGVALARCGPRSVAVLGVAGGNGLDRIDPRITTRVAGFDVNPRYLDETRRRYEATLNLDLYCTDLATEDSNLAPVELVHAALIFEHAGIARCLENAVRLVDAGGALSVVLQLPSEIAESVGVSGFLSMLRLKDDFRLIAPAALTEKLGERGFEVRESTTRPVPGGKRLWMGIFRRR